MYVLRVYKLLCVQLTKLLQENSSIFQPQAFLCYFNLIDTWTIKSKFNPKDVQSYQILSVEGNFTRHNSKQNKQQGSSLKLPSSI